MRIVKLAIVLVAAVTSCTSNKVKKSETPEKPNVILVITDDQGYGDLAVHGNKIIKTPIVCHTPVLFAYLPVINADLVGAQVGPT